MNVYKELNRTRPINYSYKMKQMIEIMKDNLTSEQKKVFNEFIDKMRNEQYELIIDGFQGVALLIKIYYMLKK